MIRKIVNLTPHDIVVIGDDKEVVIKSSGVVRLSEIRRKLFYVVVDGEIIPVYEKRFGSADLPPKEDGVLYIVSLPVAQAYPERDDFIVPDDLVRDENGRIIGCQSFARVGKTVGGSR